MEYTTYRLDCKINHQTIGCIFHFENNLHMPDKDKVIIFDTTMRDGEQSPVASMSVEEKIQISRVFD